MLIDLLKALVLGIVEGLTEFLPISSTGHLIVLNEWLSFGDRLTFIFDIVIQLGAILAVVVTFRKRLWPFNPDKTVNQPTVTLWTKVTVAVLPALVAGALLNDFMEAKLFNPVVVALSLLIGGIILLVIERRPAKPKFTSLGELSFKTALLIGLIQCLSMIPGTSRAAATIIGAMLLGASRQTAAEFSFFLAIPTMFAATTYSLFKHGHGLTASEWVVVAVGFSTAFVSALVVIRFFLRYVQNHDFKLFGYYRIVLGSLILGLFVTGVIML